MITADEYAQIVGALAPIDFDACEAVACDMLHAYTLYAYLGRDIEKMPAPIVRLWKRSVALQTQAISEGGGLAALGEGGLNTVSLGDFSYSGGQSQSGTSSQLSPTVALSVPVLLAYGRGLRKCDPSL